MAEHEVEPAYPEPFQGGYGELDYLGVGGWSVHAQQLDSALGELTVRAAFWLFVAKSRS